MIDHVSKAISRSIKAEGVLCDAMRLEVGTSMIVSVTKSFTTSEKLGFYIIMLIKK